MCVCVCVLLCVSVVVAATVVYQKKNVIAPWLATRRQDRDSVRCDAVYQSCALFFFQDADVPVYKQMYDYMISHPEVLTSTTDEGIQRVGVHTIGLQENSLLP